MEEEKSAEGQRQPRRNASEVDEGARERKSKELEGSEVVKAASNGTSFTSPSMSGKDLCSESFRDWASLPQDILDLLFRRLPLPDAIRSSAACKQWQSIAKCRRRPEPPWIWYKSGKFYSLSEDQVYILNLPEYVLDNHTFCFGSCEEWLIMGRSSSEMDDGVKYFIFNPFSATRIELPTSPCHWATPKIILSSSTKIQDCLAVRFKFDDGVFAYCRLTGKASEWRELPTEKEYTDIIFYNQLLYVTTNMGELKQIAISSSSHIPHEVCTVLPPPPVQAASFALGVKGMHVCHLMESGGELLMVHSFLFDALIHSTLQPNAVFMANLRCRRWETVESLGNRTIFLNKYSYATIRDAKLFGLEEDCIYVDDQHFNRVDLFRVSEKKLEYGVECSFERPHCWVTPNPWATKGGRRDEEWTGAEDQW